MGTIPLPALSVRPPEQPDVAGGLQRILAMKSVLGQQQLLPGQLQQQQQQIQSTGLENQQRQQSLTDQQATTAAMKAWDGKDMNELPGLVLKNGASATAVFGMKNNILDYQTKLSALTKDQLANEKVKNDYFAQAIDNVKGLPPEQQPQAFEAAKADAIQKGHLDPQQAQGLAYQGPDQLDLLEKSLMGHSTATEQALKKAQENEATQKGEEAKQGAAAKQAEALWYQQHPNSGAPGVPGETASAADWMAKPENKGKTLSDYNIAMKKVTAKENYDLQNAGAASGPNGTPSAIAQAIASKQMAWKDAVSMRTPMAVKNQILQQVYKLDPNFDTGEFGLEQDAAKKARSGAWADTRLAYNTALDHSDMLLKAADALKNNDFRTLNSLTNKFKTEFGGSGQINYDAIANAYNHEVGSVVSKGHITDKEVETGHASLPDNANVQTIHDVVNSYKGLMTSKRDELDKIIKAGAGNKANATIATGSSSERGGGGSGSSGSTMTADEFKKKHGIP